LYWQARGTSPDRENRQPQRAKSFGGTKKGLSGCRAAIDTGTIFANNPFKQNNGQLQMRLCRAGAMCCAISSGAPGEVNDLDGTDQILDTAIHLKP